MAILSSVDGKFYEVPDDELDSFEVPPEKVKEVLEELDSAAGPEMAAPSEGPQVMNIGGGQSPQVVVQVAGGASVQQTGGTPGQAQNGASVQPYGRRRRRWWWYNHWSNCWRNCWRNCY